MVTPVTQLQGTTIFIIYFKIFILHLVIFLCHSHHILIVDEYNSYEYTFLFEIVENPVFVLKIKHFPVVHGCGDVQFCGT